MAEKKTPRRRRSVAKGNRRFVNILLICLVLVAFLVGALGALTYWHRSRMGAPPVPGPSGEPSVPGPPGVAEVPPAAHDLRSILQEELEQALGRRGIILDGHEPRREAGVLHYDLPAAFPGEAWLEALQQTLGRQDPALRAARQGESGSDVVILSRGVPLFYLHFQGPEPEPMAPPKLPPPVAGGGRIAIIVDDMGQDLTVARKLLGLDLELTMAIMPEERHTEQVAILSHRAGREILVHMPMEPTRFPEHDPGPNALMVELDAAEIRQRVAGYFSRVPHAVGGNNHMGSRFSADSEGMAAVMSAMKEGGWFFIDSRTSPDSVGPISAVAAGVPVRSRDVFLDNDREVAAIRAQIRKLAARAQRQGQAIGICHPYPETVAALAQEAAWIRSQGITVVPVSALLKEAPKRTKALAAAADADAKDPVKSTTD